MSDRRKRSWFSRLGRGILYLCVLAVVLFWVAKLWVLPQIVRSQAREHIGELWSGTVQLGDVDLNLSGMSYIRGVTLKDKLGRIWLEIPEIRIEPAWDGYTPSLKALTINSVNVLPQFVGGRCTIPLKRSKRTGKGRPLAEAINDLKGIDLKVGFVAFKPVNADVAGVLDGIAVPDRFDGLISRTDIILKDILWTGGEFSVAESSGSIGDDPITIAIGGGIQDDESVKLDGQVRGAIGQESLAAKFDLGLRRDGSGRFAVKFDGRIQGDVSGEVRPDQTVLARVALSASKILPEKFQWLIGSHRTVHRAIDGSDFTIRLDATSAPGKPIEMLGDAEFTGPIGRAEAKIKGQLGDKGLRWADADITGDLCDGKIQAKLRIDSIGDKPMKFNLDAVADQVNMPELTRIITPNKIMDSGVGAGEISVSMFARNTAGIKGKGAFFLDNADPAKVPILSDLFAHMNIKLTSADLRGSFELRGMIATIKTGQLATTIWAADAEAGGTVDLASRDVDMYVLFLPIKQAGPILSALDAVNPLKLLVKEDPLTLIVKKIIRQHVTGTLDKPVITPEPLSDLSKAPAGAVNFFKSVAQGAGQLGGIFKAIFNGGK